MDQRDVCHVEKTFSFREAITIFFLCLATFACYANSLQNGFVGDDYYLIEINRETLSLKAAFNSLLSADRLFDNDNLPYYRPLTRFSFIVDKYIFGLNPAGFHAVNITLHLLCTVLAYLTFLRLGHAHMVSVVTALLFGVHPINSEAVNFIAARNNILAAVFVLLSFLAYLYAETNAGSKQRRSYILSAGFFFLALLSKETGAMLLPLLILFKSYQQLKKNRQYDILKWDMTYILYHVLFLALYLALRYVAIDGNYVQNHLSGVSDRAIQLLYIIPTYFSLIITPANLTWPHYMPRNYSQLLVPIALWWSALIFVFLYSIFTSNRINRYKFWLSWLLINFIPISNIVPFTNLPMAERYLYLPVLGLFVLAVEMVYSTAVRMGAVKTLHLALACLFLFLGIRTFERNLDWKSDLSLTLSAVRTNPASARSHFFLGSELYLQGMSQESRQEFETSVLLDPESDCASWSYYYLGALNIEAGRLEEANRCFSKSGVGAAQYVLESFFPASLKTGEDLHTRRVPPMTKAALSFIPEMNDRRMRQFAGITHDSIRYPADRKTGYSRPGDWLFFHRFVTGTKLYFDPAVRIKGKDLTIAIRQVLAPVDTLSYSFRIVAYPLTTAVEVRSVLRVNCPQKVFTAKSMEFLDNEANVLGRVFPEKEEPLLPEYLLPGSPIRALSDKLCREKFN